MTVLPLITKNWNRPSSTSAFSGRFSSILFVLVFLPINYLSRSWYRFEVVCPMAARCCGREWNDALWPSDPHWSPPPEVKGTGGRGKAQPRFLPFGSQRSHQIGLHRSQMEIGPFHQNKPSNPHLASWGEATARQGMSSASATNSQSFLVVCASNRPPKSSGEAYLRTL